MGVRGDVCELVPAAVFCGAVLPELTAAQAASLLEQVCQPPPAGQTLFHSKAKAAKLLTCVAVQHGGNLKRALCAKL